LANVEDILVKLLTEINTYETLLEKLRKE